jgi:Cu2+-containing amine oxidase
MILTLAPDAQFTLAPAAQRFAPHPPIPLSAAEIATAVRILRNEVALAPGVRFAAVTLLEPAKEFGSGREAGDPIARDAAVLAYDPALGAAYEAVVAVDDGFVRSFQSLPDAQLPDRWNDLEAPDVPPPDPAAAECRVA